MSRRQSFPCQCCPVTVVCGWPCVLALQEQLVSRLLGRDFKLARLGQPLRAHDFAPPHGVPLIVGRQSRAVLSCCSVSHIVALSVKAGAPVQPAWDVIGVTAAPVRLRARMCLWDLRRCPGLDWVPATPGHYDPAASESQPQADAASLLEWVTASDMGEAAVGLASRVFGERALGGLGPGAALGGAPGAQVQAPFVAPVSADSSLSGAEPAGVSVIACSDCASVSVPGLVGGGSKFPSCALFELSMPFISLACSPLLNLT